MFGNTAFTFKTSHIVVSGPQNSHGVLCYNIPQKITGDVVKVKPALHNDNKMIVRLSTVLITIVLFAVQVRGQDAAAISAIKKELALIYERDQKTRKGIDSAAYIAFIDSTNLRRVEDIISKYGWLGRSVIGGRGNNTLYLVIQHADLKTQERYLPLLKKSVDDSESRPVDLAYLQDRILMRQGKKQLYGSQVVFDKTGAQVFHPIEDEKNVNVRRASVGLEPIEEYARYFGINYQLPKD